MALKFALVKSTGDSRRDGYYGFAWSTLLAGPLAPFLRGDFSGSFWVMLTEVAICALVFLLDRNPLLLVARLGIVTFVWALLYNELYTLKLMAGGFRVEGPHEVVAALERRFPAEGRANRIRLLRERCLAFVVLGLGCLQAIVSVPNSLVGSSVDSRQSAPARPASEAPRTTPTPTPKATVVARATETPHPGPTATLAPTVAPTPAEAPRPPPSSVVTLAASPTAVPAATGTPRPTPTPSFTPAPTPSPTAAPRANETPRPSPRLTPAALAERQRACDAAMGSQFDTDLPGGPYVADTSVLSEADIDRAISSCEIARTGPGRRFSTELGRAYAARAVLLASRGNEAEARDYLNRAVNEWKAAETQGSGAAMNFLGALYKGTFNSPTFTYLQPDYPTALDYWLRGNDAGNLKAARNAGGMLLLGPSDFPGVGQNIRKSTELLNKAIDGGDMTAASLYGQALFYGYPPEVGKNQAAGIGYLVRACNAGDASAKAFFDTEFARPVRSPVLPRTRPAGC